jgi:hypothetical protein
MDEQPRPDANADERAYTFSVEDALLRYEAAGHGRTPRALQKYCARGDLDCIKEDTEFGQRYLITSASVARHLAQIEEIRQANGRGQSRTDAAVRSLEANLEHEKIDDASVRDHSRPDANVRAEEHSADVDKPAGDDGDERSRTVASDARFTEQLERENAYLREQNDKKDQQLERRDRQIDAMIERDRETNILIKGLQELIPQLGEGEQRVRSFGGRDNSAITGDNPETQA